MADTMGLLVAVVATAAKVSDNAGGTAAVDLTGGKRERLTKIWHDRGFTKTFTLHCSDIGIASQSVSRTSRGAFEVLPQLPRQDMPVEV